jgi:hypothetical protein
MNVIEVTRLRKEYPRRGRRLIVLSMYASAIVVAAITHFRVRDVA